MLLIPVLLLQVLLPTSNYLFDALQSDLYTCTSTFILDVTIMPVSCIMLLRLFYLRCYILDKSLMRPSERLLDDICCYTTCNILASYVTSSN